MKLSRWMLVMLAVCFFPLAGCSKDTSSSGGGASGGIDVKQSTAKEAVETFCLAADKMDVDALTAVVHPDYAKPFGAMMGYMKKMIAKQEELAKTVEDKIGKEEAKPIRISTASMSSGPTAGAMNDGKIDWTRIEIKEDGDKATVKLAGKEKPLSMVKLNGKWYAVPEQAGKTAKDMEQQVVEMKTIFDKEITKTDALIAKIKAGKVTKDTLNTEMSNMGDE